MSFDGIGRVIIPAGTLRIGDAEGMRLDVQRRLGCRMEDLTTALVFSIAWDFGADIEVASDMWFGVSVWIGDGDEFSGYVECDSPLDGLCVLWWDLAAKYPDKAPVRGPHDPAMAQSAESVAACFAARDTWESHKTACVECVTEDGWKLCADGKAKWDASIEAHIAIDQKWGLPYGDDAPTFYGFTERA